MIGMDERPCSGRLTNAHPRNARATSDSPPCVWLMVTMLVLSLVPRSGFAQQATGDQAADVDPFAAFVDDGLREAGQQACAQVEAKDEPLTVESLLKLRYLEIRDAQVESLSGLEAYTELTQLKLSGNRIADLTPLATCTKLELLEIANNRIGNLTPLQTLTSLRLLNIDGNRVDSLMPLQTCRELRLLSARDNQISDLDACRAMTKLHALFVSGNQVKTPVLPVELAALATVDLSGNQVDSLEEIGPLPRLSWLFLAGNQIEQLEPLVVTVRRQLAASQKRVWPVTVRLEGNPLTEESRKQCIQLRQLGATVTDTVISVKPDDSEQPAATDSSEPDSDE